MKKSLVTFVNKHLNKINLEVYDLDTQFSDGVYLCLLSGLLEGYFVPLYDFHLTPQVIIRLDRRAAVYFRSVLFLPCMSGLLNVLCQASVDRQLRVCGEAN